MIKRGRHLLSLFVWAGAAAFGADADEGETTVSAVWMPGMAGAMRELYVTPGDRLEPEPLRVGSGVRGRETSFARGEAASLKLVVKAVNPPAGAPAWQPVGEVALPEGDTNKILLVLTAPAGATEIRGVAVADDVAAFPIGTVRLANLTDRELALTVGPKDAMCAAGFSAPVPYAKTAPLGATEIPAFPLMLAAEGRVFFKGRIEALPGSRTLVLAVPSSVAGKDPVVKTIIDRPAPPPAAK